MLTQAQSTQFSRYSAANAARVESILTCGCRAYQDVFTYNRWQSQGYQVLRGEHAIKIPVLIETEDAETKEHHRRLWRSAVFCRHQVKATGSKPVALAIVPKEESRREEPDDIMRDWRLV